MSKVALHDDIILFDHCNVAILPLLLALRTGWAMVLLRLNNMATKHLRIFNLNLRIVEDVIVVINVLYYLNRLLVLMSLLLWLR